MQSQSITNNSNNSNNKKSVKHLCSLFCFAVMLHLLISLPQNEIIHGTYLRSGSFHDMVTERG